MSSSDAQNGILHLGQDEKRRVGRLAGRIKTVTEFLSDAVEKAKNLHFPDAIAEAAPWAETVVGATADAVAEVVPPVKFLLKLCEKLAEVNDPEELGHLACTVAFERVAEKIIRGTGGPMGDKRAVKEAKAQLALLEPSEEVDLGSFTYEHALEHEFFKRAEAQLQAVLIVIGYNGAQVDRISNMVKDEFVPALKKLLAHRETAEKFAPFREFIALGPADEKAAYKALAEHLKFQRWLYEEAPVLRKSPFALRHVYIETDCGKLTWGEIIPTEIYPRIRHASEEHSAERKSKDPFSEQDGDRHPLIETIIDLIRDLESREPIIVQGVAGAGKSSFTLRLCVELQRRQLRPILIRFKDIRFDQHISEALPRAVRLSDEQRSPGSVPLAPKNLFRGGAIFRERGSGAYSDICRYVLILDGWDEISVANEGFKKRVERILEQIRNEYIDPPGLTVRVVMTGRPSPDVNESGFLREDTPILTIRPLTPGQLRDFTRDLSIAVTTRPVKISGEAIWPETFDLAKFEPIFKQYELDFNRLQRKQEAQGEKRPHAGSLGVLGLPLLAQLAARLISSWRGQPEQLIDNPTTLYRNLVNLTCKKGAKEEDSADSVVEIKGQSRIVGRDLRQLLWRTASAMTVYGKDLIPYEELSSRLDMEGDELDESVSHAAREHTLSALLISFYFKGGFRHTGCEFVHKSFREYLYAEALVEELKEYGQPEREALPARAPYWKEFGEEDPRYDFSRRLAQLFAQWLSPEVAFHLDHLIEWELTRAAGVAPYEEAGMTTLSLSIEGWRRVRDGLADLWDWWGEGVHLRPQPYKGPRRELLYKEPFVSELIQNSLSLEAARSTHGAPRTATLDAHLGYGLFTLCVLVHHYLLAAGDEAKQDAPAGGDPVAPRAYQSEAKEGAANGAVRFAPSKPGKDYFKNYTYRIASAGLRPNGWFPAFCDLRSVDLSDAYLISMDLFGARLDNAVLRRGVLYRATLDDATLVGADLRAALLEQATLQNARLSGANLSLASLDDARITGGKLDGADLSGASLISVRFSRVVLYKADLSAAYLSRSWFHETDLRGANLSAAKLNGVVIEYSHLDDAILEGAEFEGADLSSSLGLKAEQIAKALLGDAVKLPHELSEQPEG
jgi:uncharacterized protein YjbI with pentapeptide repeats